MKAVKKTKKKTGKVGPAKYWNVWSSVKMCKFPEEFKLNTAHLMATLAGN